MESKLLVTRLWEATQHTFLSSPLFPALPGDAFSSNFIYSDAKNWGPHQCKIANTTHCFIMTGTSTDGSQYLQVTLAQPTVVIESGTKGRPGSDQHIKSYRIA